VLEKYRLNVSKIEPDLGERIALRVPTIETLPDLGELSRLLRF
jgi:hypothetical protein